MHPLSGKGNGCKIWETVAPIFSRAKVQTKVKAMYKLMYSYWLLMNA